MGNEMKERSEKGASTHCHAVLGNLLLRAPVARLVREGPAAA